MQPLPTQMKQKITRKQILYAFLAVTVCVAAGLDSRADEQVPKTASTTLPYPAEVSLVDESPNGWTYRQNLTGLPLYFYAKDSRGKSICYGGCATQWIPLQAPPKARSLGQWIIVKRKDGTRQWAFKGRPVYLHIHDTAASPGGDGEDGAWHVMPHFQSSAEP